MSAVDRRDLVIDAAMSAFALGGYHGTKLELFLEVLERATDRIRHAFEAVLADGEFDPNGDLDKERLEMAYAELLAGGVEEIAALSRTCMSRIFLAVRRTGWDDDAIHDFVAHGMLINVMLSMRAPEHQGEDEALDQLSRCAFSDALGLIGPAT